MRPSEALPQDWGLYYHGTYMLHETFGPVHVRVEDSLYARPINTKGTYKKVKPEDLSVWFPPRGAYNYGSDAVYIARKAVRAMRKSMSLSDIYYVLGPAAISPQSIPTILHSTKDKDRFTGFPSALQQLRNGSATARAVDRNLILGHMASHDWTREGVIAAYYRGRFAGHVPEKDTKIHIARPELAASKYIASRLTKGGIPCILETK